MIHDLAEAIKFDQSKLNEFNRIKDIETNHTFRLLTRENFEDIRALYNSYNEDVSNGSNKEFLYIPKDSEILETLSSDDKAYVGFVTAENKILGLVKIEELKENSPFFVPPSFEKDNNPKFFGFSGLIIKPSHRRTGLGKELTARTGRILHRLGATGFYADCDFRNDKSFKTLSKTMDFLGFTDGRNGEEGEQTIYTTFYKSFSDNSITYESGLELDFSKAQTFDDVANVLIAKMNEYGGYDRTKVKYGKGYNLIYVLRNKIDTSKEKSLLIKPQNEISLNIDNRLQNGNDNNMMNVINMTKMKQKAL